MKWDSLYEKEKPFQIFTNLLPDSQDRRKSNLAWDEREVLVEDLRGQERDFQMDASGFATCQLPGFADLSDPEAIREEYLPAVEDMLRRELDDVGTVVVFDWRVSDQSSYVRPPATISLSFVFPLAPRPSSPPPPDPKQQH